MIYGGVSAREICEVYAEMGLPEPFIFPYREPWGNLAGMVTGFIRTNGVAKYLDVDHMIVRPSARRKFRVMMEMSEAAAQAAFDAGCGYILTSIFLNDPRRSGLSAWAKRMGCTRYGTSEDAEWFVRHNERLVYDNGQGRKAPRSEAAPGSS